MFVSFTLKCISFTLRFVEDQVAVIYVCGMVSSALFAPAKELAARKFGRRKTCVLLCLLYATSCLMTLSSNYGVLIVGRCLSGSVTSLLFYTMEGWYAHEHTLTHDFPAEWLGVTFGLVAFASSAGAVFAGVLADAFARWFALGPVSPFVVASPLFVASACLIRNFWTENFDAKKKELTTEAVRESCMGGLRVIAQDFDVFLIGAIQSVFETVLFVFVFMWTPVLDVFHDVPLGIAFSSFMVCFLLGTIVCNYLIRKVGYSATRVLVAISGSCVLVFLLLALFTRDTSSFLYRVKVMVCLQAFELLCGFYFPIMRVLRERIFPDEHHLSLINWFRVPLTLLSSLVLLFLHSPAGGMPEIFVFCACLMALACLCSLRFASASARGSNGSESRGDESQSQSLAV